MDFLCELAGELRGLGVWPITTLKRLIFMGVLHATSERSRKRSRLLFLNFRNLPYYYYTTTLDR